jgi:hypothetical protein
MFEYVETELLVRVTTLERYREIRNSVRASEARARHRSPPGALITDPVKRSHRIGRNRLGRGGQTC